MIKALLRFVKMSKKDEKLGKASFSGVDEVVKEKYVFGKYEEKEMLTKLKVLALNHDKPGVTHDSIRPLRDQTLRVRKVMSRTNPEFPQVSLWKYACFFSYLIVI